VPRFSPPPPPVPPRAEDRTTRGDAGVDEDERLDEELDETFPASDPIPWTHRDG
jgi:hypothetical protein